MVIGHRSLVIGHSSLVIVVDLGKSNGALSTGVSEPAHGGGCRPLAIIFFRIDHQFIVCFTVESG